MTENFLTCERAYTRKAEEVSHKVERALKLLHAFRKKDCSIAYSGGKDSDVIAHLAKLAGIDAPLIHHVTTIDPPGTLQHCLHNGAILIRPKLSFFHLLQKKGYPTMWRRFCCAQLKEFYDTPVSIQGIRAAESNRRAARYKEPTTCRVYSKKQHTEVVLPILNWTNEDVAFFVNSEHINCHPLYYDAKSRFCVNNRLGCLGCPLQSDRGRRDFLLHPVLLQQWCRNLKVWYNNHGNSNLYRDMVYHIFYSNHGLEKASQHFDGLFPHADYKTLLEDYFQCKLPSL